VAAMLYPRGAIVRRRQRSRPQFQRHAADYYAKANDRIAGRIQCEHIQAVENADAIFSVPGIDAIFVGPNDLARACAARTASHPAPKRPNQANKHILATCKKQASRPAITA